jgi:hypothetical protein
VNPSQPAPVPDQGEDPFRWSRADRARVHADFSDPRHTPSSQRQYAQQHGIPRSTLGTWVRQASPDEFDTRTVDFLRNPAGELFLRHIVVAAMLVFHQANACGLRTIGQFLRLAKLDSFVASSYGALHSLAASLQTELGRFSDEEQPRLAATMTPKTITLAADENFHGPKPCLVAIEPVSNFLVVESYRDRRDGDTWTEAIQVRLKGLPVRVVLLTSDQAKGLLRCAHDGLDVLQSPDLFHRQRDLLQPVLLPLTRPIEQAQKELAKAQQNTHRLDAEIPPEGLEISRKAFENLVEAVRDELQAAKKLEQSQEPKEQVIEQVRGVGDDYHPFDRQTGRPLTENQVEQRLVQRVDRLQEVSQQAGLGERAEEALTKAKSWLGTLVAVVAWFWTEVRQQVEKLELNEGQERVVLECLLAGHYWEQAAGRARQPEERQRLKELADRLKKQAWGQDGVLSLLPKEQREEVDRVSRQCGGLFSRSSSCVEGRNGRLSLHHHGQGRLSEGKLKALTTVHNYVVERADGTTAAERFFGSKPRNVFAWLLERLPDLPRPAAKRPKKAAMTTPLLG